MTPVLNKASNPSFQLIPPQAANFDGRFDMNEVFEGGHNVHNSQLF